MTRGGAPISLILVDDEIEFLAATARMLDRRGIDVYTACCGEEALGLLRRQPVDVLVSDVAMPGLDGEALYDLVRREHPWLPVIMLTAFGNLHQAFRMTQDGVAAYLCKPCDADDLVARVREAARLARRAANAGVGSGAAEDGDEPVRALLVDDEPAFLTALSRALGRRGVGTCLAPGARDALEALARREFDVVVLNERMPDLNGLEMLERIKRDHPDYRVILLSGNPALRTAVRGLWLGAIDYVVKPPDADELAERIREAARKRHRELRERRYREAARATAEPPA